MAASDYSRGPTVSRAMLCNAHVQRQEFDRALRKFAERKWIGYTEAQGLANFLKALADSDKTLADTVLREWGVR